MFGFVKEADIIAETANNAAERQKFIDSLVSVLSKHQFDGLHIGIIYDESVYNASTVSILMNGLSMNLKPRKLLLSFSPMKPVTPRSNVFDSFAPIVNNLDFMHLQYFSDIDRAIALGVPPPKIIIEVLVTTAHARHTSINIFNFDSFKSYLRYDEVCDLLKTEKIKSIVYDNVEERVQTVYIDEAGHERSFLFENARSVANKTRNAMRRNLAGVAMFTVDADDSEGRCPIQATTFDDFKVNANVNLNIPTKFVPEFPIMRTVNKAIQFALEEMKQLRIPYSKSVQAKSVPQSDAFSWDIFLGNLVDSF